MIASNGIVIRNIYHMLAYAYRALRHRGRERVECEPFEHAEDLLAQILELGLAGLVKRGLHRDYRPFDEDLRTVRGTIRLADSMRHRMHKRRLIACTYDQLTPDNTLNRILKSTAEKLAWNLVVRKDLRANLKKTLAAFDGVASIDLSTVRWSQLQIGGQTETYGLLLNVCRLVAERALLTEEEGVRKLDAWIQDENNSALFERFLRGYFAVQHPDLRPSGRAIRWDTSSGAPTSAIIPGMFADLVLTGPERVLVVDAKFYKRVLSDSRFEKQKIRSDHLYQINAYVTNIAAAYPGKETAGMLIYAKTENESVPDTAFRSAGHELSVVTLDLTGDFASIAARLDAIAESVRRSRSV
ncbi:5-methylcytosine restriction system specificity protein McrC [Sutterella megalosphaeroides]|uniref:5-methylcytosine-specific restriction system specificity protein McrC n=1 Tax=Sutterella megalosphaeroides TaxID=2494234 RepID=A0A2Z6I9Y9_9BURK|nr:hypothetical protein [Sutterella megalosphaeroides]BBF23311.1 5-methylcytosine-specific restriction system specificity protein McrC [Sutterella megalosphaeroides]